MTSAITESSADWAAGTPLPNSPTRVRTNSSALIRAAFISALFQLGGLSWRGLRPGRPPRSCAVGLRPVRPRDSIDPAALPRCFVLRLRLVGGIVATRVDDPRPRQ